MSRAGRECGAELHKAAGRTGPAGDAHPPLAPALAPRPPPPQAPAPQPRPNRAHVAPHVGLAARHAPGLRDLLFSQPQLQRLCLDHNVLTQPAVHALAPALAAAPALAELSCNHCCLDGPGMLALVGALGENRGLRSLSAYGCFLAVGGGGFGFTQTAGRPTDCATDLRCRV